MPANPYDEPRIDIKSLEKAMNETISEMEAANVDLVKLRDKKKAELVALQAEVDKHPLTDLQRRVIIKRVLINCLDRQLTLQGGTNG